MLTYHDLLVKIENMKTNCIDWGDIIIGEHILKQAIFWTQYFGNVKTSSVGSFPLKHPNARLRNSHLSYIPSIGWTFEM